MKGVFLARVKHIGFLVSLHSLHLHLFFVVALQVYSAYHHCKAFYFRFIFSFILFITSFTLHWPVFFLEKLPLPCCGADAYRHLFRLMLLSIFCFSFSIAKLLYFSKISTINYLENIYNYLENT